MNYYKYLYILLYIYLLYINILGVSSVLYKYRIITNFKYIILYFYIPISIYFLIMPIHGVFEHWRTPILDTHGCSPVYSQHSRDLQKYIKKEQRVITIHKNIVNSTYST